VKRVKNIVFDLDGTLTDPVEGITRCIQYALERLERPCPSLEVLASHIGPPLRQTFADVCDSSDGALIEQAVALYRERFATVGLYENYVYEGVPEMLAELGAAGRSLFVATSKPKLYAERILEHFSLAERFVEALGNDMDGRLDDKAEMLDELIERHRLSRGETIMVGDRKFDVVAAKTNGIRSIGVLYGYGSGAELMEAGADYICHTPLEVAELLKEMKSAERC
jgi:phosphoglycolate phosphatase